MLLLTEDFKLLCKGAMVYVDTNVFINAQARPELLGLIGELRDDYSTAFITLSSVEYEYTRGSRTLGELKSRREFVRELVDTVMPVNRILESDKNDVFSATMSLIVGKKNSDYTDYLLATALHSFNNGIERHFVLSADAKAFPTSLFDICGVITISKNTEETVHLNLIELNRDKYKSILSKVGA